MVRICVNCRYVKITGYDNPKCTHSDTRDLVDGSERDCKDVRNNERLCGMQGRHFIRKSIDEENVAS